MKSLIYFSPPIKQNCFLGARLRKNIKGALELGGIQYVESILASPNIIEIISPDDETKAIDAKLEDVLLIVNALYTELDANAKYLKLDSDGLFLFKSKSEKLLESADVINVPSIQAKETLAKLNLVNKRVEVITPGVNLSRFKLIDEIEQNIFYKYFQIPKNKKFIVSIGDVSDEKTILTIENIAASSPDFLFIHFCVDKNNNFPFSYVNKLNKKSPKNLIYSNLIDDDIYCSCLHNATAFLFFESNYFADLMVLEAMASNTQIFAVGDYQKISMFINKENSYCCLNEDDVVDKLNLFFVNKLPPLTKKAYECAKENSISNLAKKKIVQYMRLTRERGIYD